MDHLTATALWTAGVTMLALVGVLYVCSLIAGIVGRWLR